MAPHRSNSEGIRNSNDWVYAFLIGLILFLTLFAPLSSAEGLQPWTPTTSYPFIVYLHSCASFGSYVYCIGGDNGTTDGINSAYYATFNSNGIGRWNPTTSYPTSVRQETCLTDSGNIYCIGGGNTTGIFNYVYYAQATPSGLGAWQLTTSYPVNAYKQSCVDYSEYFYCVGGYNGGFTNSVYYAPVTSHGLGSWLTGTPFPYPIAFESCVAYSGYIYCVGGDDNGVTGFNTTSDVYYAPLSSTGVGSWSKTTDYPIHVAEGQCVELSGYIYCIGGIRSSAPGDTVGDVYYSHLSSSGVGPWQYAGPYGLDPIWGQSCVSQSNRLYCIAGQTGHMANDVYYTLVPNATTTFLNCGTSQAIGSSVTCVAIVHGTNPSGVIFWSSNTTSSFSSLTCTLAAGNCSVTITPKTLGPLKIVASYQGDFNNTASSSSLILNIVSTTSVTNSYSNSSTKNVTTSMRPTKQGWPSILYVVAIVLLIIIIVAGTLLLIRRRMGRDISRHYKLS